MKEKQIIGFILEPDQDMMWATGYELHGYTITRKVDTWLLVIKVNGQRGKRLVTFIECATPFECYALWYHAMHSNDFKLTWRVDKFTQL